MARWSGSPPPDLEHVSLFQRPARGHARSRPGPGTLARMADPDDQLMEPGAGRIVVVDGQRVSPAVAEIVGWRRERTASMISLGSIPCRYVLGRVGGAGGRVRCRCRGVAVA